MTLSALDREKAANPKSGTRTIAVLMGGGSRERPVSLLSGQAVAEALASLGHVVRPTDVRPGDVNAGLLEGVDVAFLALHGPWGEDGGIQTELESLGACYTFSGAEASRLAMDKDRAKRRFIERGIPTPAYRLVERGHQDALVEAFETLGPNLVVKPVADGSSLGISMVATLAGLRRAADQVWSGGDAALVERRIDGREFTVGILGDEALPVIEIRVAGGWYDYHNKYESDKTQFVFDHGLPAVTEQSIVAASVAAHQALGCRDLSRVDVMLDCDDVPQVLEINTIPGFTSHSLVPKAAARAGLPFPRLCERLVTMALRRSDRRA
jgi:D-alanine-D-alanine ligase